MTRQVFKVSIYCPFSYVYEKPLLWVFFNKTLFLTKVPIFFSSKICITIFHTILKVTLFKNYQKVGKREVVGIFAKMFRTFVYILEENNQQTQIAKQKFKKF